MEETRRANQAAVAQAAEAKRRGEAAMGNLIDLGTNATAKDYLIAIQENPALASSITEMKDMLGSERVAGETQFGTQLFSALNKNPDFAKTLLEERRLAAEAAGDQRTVDTMKSYQMMMDQPEGPEMVLALTGTALAGIMDKDQFEIMTNTLGLGGGAEDPAKVAELKFRAKEAGLVPGTAEYNEFMVRGGEAEKGPLVQNILGASETEFAKTAGEKIATQFSAITEQGTTASRSLTELENLESLLANVETGGTAAIKEYLGGFGIATEGLGDIQAVSAAINRLIPQQRPPSSGPMTDKDVVLFAKSVPALINQPGGNQIIIDTLRAINEYDVAASIIAGQALDLEITPAEARKRLRELPNPLADFKAPKAVKPGAAPVVIDGVTIQRIE
jgi:hypothetical protein